MVLDLDILIKGNVSARLSFGVFLRHSSMSALKSYQHTVSEETLKEFKNHRAEFVKRNDETFEFGSHTVGFCDL